MTSRLAVTTALAMLAGSASAQPDPDFFYTYTAQTNFPSINEVDLGNGEFGITVSMPLLSGTSEQHVPRGDVPVNNNFDHSGSSRELHRPVEDRQVRAYLAGREPSTVRQCEEQLHVSRIGPAWRIPAPASSRAP